ncbi:hypothetical protein BDR26DRAFT_849304 [Obelidium mucronatum]|nr:hypothetical protein BDR26DRAFT_849304 [Obelidium mucronatum]
MSKPVEAPSDHVWYFAYGSNMAQSTMIRRKFQPQKSHQAVLPDYCLSMGMRGILPYTEPAFATIYKRSSLDSIEGISTDDNVPDVHGVVHLLTSAEFQRIVYTEGGNGHKGLGYQQTAVLVNLIDEHGTVVGSCHAVTLVSMGDDISPDYWPSKRYLDLCVEGAKQQKIPAKYIEWLASHESYDPASRTVAKRIGAYAIMIFALPVTLPIFLIGGIFLYNGLQPPRIVSIGLAAAFSIMRYSHRWVFRHIFGSGINHLDVPNRRMGIKSL